MRIGIDARFYGTSAKGLGRYTQKLITHLEQLDDEHEYVVFLRDENWNEYQPRTDRVTKVKANFRWYTLAEQLFFPMVLRRQKLDLMHFTHFNVPLLYRQRFIVTIHDLILTKYPTQRASKLGPLLYKIKHAAYHLIIRHAVRHAAKIIAVSKFTKQDIMQHFGIAGDRIAVTYEAVDLPAQGVLNDMAVLEKYDIQQPYILYVGNVYPHKNIERLLEAFALVRRDHPDVQLVLVGKEDYFVRRIRYYISQQPYANAVHLTGYVPDEELPSLYRHAAVYAFPSLCEGFGLPGLEACAFGAPVVASNNSCLPEILDAAAVYFDPHRSDDIARAIMRVLGDAELREKLIRSGHNRVQDFRWEDMAQRTVELYRSV